MDRPTFTRTGSIELPLFEKGLTEHVEYVWVRHFILAAKQEEEQKEEQAHLSTAAAQYRSAMKLC